MGGRRYSEIRALIRYEYHPPTPPFIVVIWSHGFYDLELCLILCVDIVISGISMRILLFIGNK